MAVTCSFSGRTGNIFFNIAMMVAYAKKHNMEYYIPEVAMATANKKPTITIPSTCKNLIDPESFRELIDEDGRTYFMDIPAIENVIFKGYFQSFKYFDWCRDYVLKLFNFPLFRVDLTSIHVRRGDCVGSESFPLAPIEYYQNAISKMMKLGFDSFIVFSDDIEWCRTVFLSERFDGALFFFSEGNDEVDDFFTMLNCTNNITARSTFSLTAAWANRNENKIVLVPSDEKILWWKGQNKDLIPEYFKKVDFL